MTPSSSFAPPFKATLSLLSSLTPPSASRAWLSAPHPYLPIIATASSDKSVRIYSLTSFALLSTISGGHKRSIRSCAWKPGAKGESVLATGSFDASAGIWRRWDDGGLVPRPDPEEQERDYTNGDNADEDEDEEWRFAVVLDGHESEVKSVAWSAGGQFLATCSRDKSVWIWEEMEDDNFETIAVLQEHEGDVKCVVWHPEEELLASASYDDTIRLYREDLDDWTCVAIVKGHDSTVWALDFEPVKNPSVGTPPNPSTQQNTYLAAREASGPRLISSSDDLSIRVWRRIPKQKPTAPPAGQGKIPSIIRTNSIEEEWVQEATLPQRHDRAVYSVAWSEKSGKVVSTGGDGKIIVYEERWRPNTNLEGNGRQSTNGDDTAMADANGTVDAAEGDPDGSTTEWVVVAEMEEAHGVFEINGVCWSRRFDKGKQGDDEEIILSTGDDGQVKAWTLDVS
ncbi:MAG: Cytosolic iron-sulfur protein assembly protein [Pycnora praestabilis]|nr:MAG: Cytosolic iron-sulfur protein assembly protein [Pycnora praestabilis]